MQSVALRLICDREAEIAAFEPEEYWSITAKLKKVDGQEFEAKLHLRGGEKVDITSRDEAEEILRALGGARYVVRSVTRRERRRRPAAPFTTSTMQQEASRKLGFTARKTMSLAQDLYEGMDVGPEGTVGLITYLRTDSTEVAAEAQAEARFHRGEVRCGVPSGPSAALCVAERRIGCPRSDSPDIRPAYAGVAQALPEARPSASVQTHLGTVCGKPDGPGRARHCLVRHRGRRVRLPCNGFPGKVSGLHDVVHRKKATTISRRSTTTCSPICRKVKS